MSLAASRYSDSSFDASDMGMLQPDGLEMIATLPDFEKFLEYKTDY